MKRFFSVAAALLLAACASKAKITKADPYLWLEEVEGKRALDKVEAWNKLSVTELSGDPRYKENEADIRKIILAEDRIPYGVFRGGYVYNFWQDKVHVRGIWRRTTLSEYAKAQPQWETILDVDALAKKENENWVWKGPACLPPRYELCLLSLSRGGKDASVIREFDVAKKDFVKGGFELPEAKSSVTWSDVNTVFVGSDFGPGSLTSSGYPREVRKWARGTKADASPVIFSGKVEDVSATAQVAITPFGTWRMLVRSIGFFTSERHLLNERGELAKIPIPDDFKAEGVYGGWLFGVLRSDWKSSDRDFKQGSLVAVRLDDLTQPAELVFKPDGRSSIEGISASGAGLFAVLSKNVRSHLVKIVLPKIGERKGWALEPIQFQDDGSLSIISSDRFNDTIFVTYSGFLSPNSVWKIAPVKGALVSEKLRSLPPKFDASGLVVDQFEAPSRDGVMIPYFVVRPKNLKFDGQAPTLLNGYGGFNLPMNPFYLGAIGKIWAEKNRVFILANIRGGGEFGPSWHEAARLKNRQKSFDDFIGIAEDLIKRKITSPRRLGIMGGSNGGLLVGATFVQRPELFNAVVCQVPLLDMLRYHTLLAGASWMAEYGNPDDPAMRPTISAYSPYQNLQPGAKYPRVLFTTSTRDDRVHPGHARKMAARMEEQGHPFLYYENTEGGHAGAANLEQRVKMMSLEWTYLARQLAD